MDSDATKTTPSCTWPIVEGEHAARTPSDGVSGCGVRQVAYCTGPLVVGDSNGIRSSRGLSLGERGGKLLLIDFDGGLSARSALNVNLIPEVAEIHQGKHKKRRGPSARVAGYAD